MAEKNIGENKICISEVLYDSQAEQGVELDYVLPDYYPEIFKIVKCRLTPKIHSYSIIGDSKLNFDGSVDIKVLYLAENSNAIHCIEQRYTYSKTVDLGRITLSDNVMIKLMSKPDYCNCRAISGRRIDVRGAVSTKIRITSESCCPIPVMPENIQVRTDELSCCTSSLGAEKQYNIREEIETGAHGIAYIIRSCAQPKVNDVRVIADKAVIKGVITISASYGVYNPDGQGCTEVERMTADIPVSQIIDLDGIDESCKCSAEIDILSCELSCTNDSGIISCAIQTVVRLCCKREGTVMLPTDVFSTEYECDYSTKTVKAAVRQHNAEKQLVLKSSMTCDNGELEAVLDCWSDVYNVVCTMGDNGITVSGQICHQVIARSTEGLPCCYEKQEGFEETIPCDHSGRECMISYTVIPQDTDYTISSDKQLELSAKLDFCARVSESESVSLVQQATILEDKPKSRDNSYSLRIYYADGTESCWGIAKRYGASVEAIMTENEIENRDALLSGMVLIPTV